MITRILRPGSAASVWPPASVVHSLGITTPTVTIAALRLMNCLLVVGIALLTGPDQCSADFSLCLLPQTQTKVCATVLVELELRQAHDLMDQPAHFLVYRQVVGHKIYSVSL